MVAVPERQHGRHLRHADDEDQATGAPRRALAAGVARVVLARRPLGRVGVVGLFRADMGGPDGEVRRDAAGSRRGRVPCCVERGWEGCRQLREGQHRQGPHFISLSKRALLTVRRRGTLRRTN